MIHRDPKLREETIVLITQSASKHISSEQLHNLLIGKIDHQGLMELTQSASQGNLDDIDLLNNLALRRDELGHKSENILCDIFSGKIEGKEGIDLEMWITIIGFYLHFTLQLHNIFHQTTQ
ncbi:TPA: hypothetical protein RG647_RS18770 [Providencia rettgeri]|uniref:hypothetical protein n=1 Tax=Providencia sp. PROV129 TaxID=2949839 RepID=UPI00234B7715|nr:hypothetical protein [Providencia sp. PROV129]HEC8330392.1 hypothetical protein [Providencia rettgeri]